MHVFVCVCLCAFQCLFLSVRLFVCLCAFVLVSVYLSVCVCNLSVCDLHEAGHHIVYVVVLQVRVVHDWRVVT